MTRLAGPALFLLTFGLYLWTAYPSMSSYRDCGELATGTVTLGIAAAPGYPLYMSAGHMFLDLVPFGSTVYRLHVLSVFCGALAVWGVWRLLSGVAPAPAP
ncbi:MAG: DUF2723 domain-containing protein, partial [bacterium]